MLSPRVLQIGLIGSLALNLFLGGLMLGKVLRPETKVAPDTMATGTAAEETLPVPALPVMPTSPEDKPEATVTASSKPAAPSRSEPAKRPDGQSRPEGRSQDHGGGEPDGPPHGLRQIIVTLDRTDQQVLRTGLRQVMLQSREDRRTVRRLRQEAARLAAEPAFDADKVSAAMARVRAAELEGRARSEANLTATLAKLSPEGRQKVAPALLLRRRDRSDAASPDERKGADERPGL
jgi:uncharacterized membrane protein